jgi:tRNA modification GTPase
MDLTQAEAVMDVISSGNEAGRKAAFHQLQGGLSREIEEIREKVLSILVPLEAFIDFPEEEISFSRAGSPGGFKTALADLYRLRERIGRLVRSFDQGRVLREGLATAIIGRPNVGKSSLLNSLLGEDRAIVTPHPGTTRDTLEEVVQVDGIPLRITDTAGIREAVDPAEEEGIRRAKRALEGADLVLLILDASTDLLPEDDLLLEMTCGKRTIMVLNKCDLGERDWTREKGLERGLVFRVSVLHHQGMDGLKKGISRYVREVLWGQEAETETPIVTRLRHREALERANQGLGEFIAKAETPSITLDILAFHLRFVLDSLGEIVGAITPEGLLDRIFSEFCIGK